MPPMMARSPPARSLSRALAAPAALSLLPAPHRRHAASASQRHAAVAGSFIFRPAEDGPDKRTRVALFRRSAAVHTYQYVRELPRLGIRSRGRRSRCTRRKPESTKRGPCLAAS